MHNEVNIDVFNRQRKIPLDPLPLREFCHLLARRLELEAGFSVVLISDLAMQRYHLRFAGNNWPTDVLSFPVSAGSHPDFDQDPYAGDILISVETAQRQKRGSLIRELKVLSLHGLLHLIGYDHKTDGGEMVALERQFKKEFQLD